MPALYLSYQGAQHYIQLPTYVTFDDLCARVRNTLDLRPTDHFKLLNRQFDRVVEITDQYELNQVMRLWSTQPAGSLVCVLVDPPAPKSTSATELWKLCLEAVPCDEALARKVSQTRDAEEALANALKRPAVRSALQQFVRTWAAEATQQAPPRALELAQQQPRRELAVYDTTAHNSTVFVPVEQQQQAPKMPQPAQTPAKTSQVPQATKSAEAAAAVRQGEFKGVLVEHVTMVPEGRDSELVAGERRMKIWRVRNTGAAAWPEHCRLVCAEMNGCMAEALPVPRVAPNDTCDVAVLLQAGTSAQSDVATEWMLEDPSGRPMLSTPLPARIKVRWTASIDREYEDMMKRARELARTR